MWPQKLLGCDADVESHENIVYAFGNNKLTWFYDKYGSRCIAPGIWCDKKWVDWRWVIYMIMNVESKLFSYVLRLLLIHDSVLVAYKMWIKYLISIEWLAFLVNLFLSGTNIMLWWTLLLISQNATKLYN